MGRRAKEQGDRGRLAGALLTASIGNTRVALGVFKLPVTGDSPQPATAVSLPAPLSGSFSPRFQPGLVPEAAVIASVNPACDQAVTDWLRREYRLVPRRFPEEVPSPIENRYAEPSALGADRLAVAAAAYLEFRTACIVVDAGTAVTVDAVSARGEFLGGAILPGAALQARALAQGTALLPEVEAREADRVIGDSTVAGILSGTRHGLGGAVDRLVADMSAELGGRPRVLVTGGDAPLLARLCKTQLLERPNLVLTGLALAYMLCTPRP